MLVGSGTGDGVSRLVLVDESVALLVLVDKGTSLLVLVRLARGDIIKVVRSGCDVSALLVGSGGSGNGES